MNTLSQSAKRLVPSYWHLPSVKTTADLVFLGKVTVRQLIRYWRSEAENLSNQIKYYEELIKLLKGKSGKDFAKLAEGYENPKFSPAMIGKRSDSWGGDFEPLDSASQNRKSGATTFNMCGWCKYTGGGSCRYQYHITTSCNFLDDAGLPDNDQEIPNKVLLTYKAAEPLTRLGSTEGEKEAAKQALHRMEASYPGLALLAEQSPEWSTRTQRRFNTPCFLPNLDEKGVEILHKAMKGQKSKLIEKKKKVDSDIRLLLNLEKQAEDKPALSDERPYDWFNIDDKLVCYIAGWEGRLWEGDWATAKVIDGYRHQDGCVSVNYDRQVHNGPYLDGHGGGYGMARPEVLHLWEYYYLRSHPDFAKVWVASVGEHMKDFNAKKMLEALTNSRDFLALSASTSTK